MRLLQQGRVNHRTQYDSMYHRDLDTGQTWTSYARANYSDWHPVDVGRGATAIAEKVRLCAEFIAVYGGTVRKRMRSGKVTEVFVRTQKV